MQCASLMSSRPDESGLFTRSYNVTPDLSGRHKGFGEGMHVPGVSGHASYCMC